MDTYNPKNGGNDVLSMCISLAGSNLFEVGGVVQQYGVSSSGVVSLNSALGPGSAQTARTAMLNNLIGIDAQAAEHAHAELRAGVRARAGQRHGPERGAGHQPIGRDDLEKFPPRPSPCPNSGGTVFTSSLMAQLKMVGQIIEAGYRSAASGGLGMKRQVFFVQVGGYDLHTGQTGNAGSTSINYPKVIIGAQANLFAELSQGLNAFQNAMAQIGVQNSDPDFEKRVTAFTASDFGRTLPSNSLGSDHGWGSHHLVLGGSVKGANTYGKFPALVVGGPDDTSTGRWIPTTAVDQFAATMASWFGVDSTHMGTVFPNLGRFNTPNLGFMASI